MNIIEYIIIHTIMYLFMYLFGLFVYYIIHCWSDVLGDLWLWWGLIRDRM